ncbi:chloride channel protein [candidate division FCPU426 bacterium]|nr:chloride channel protein [candidate division FCPU426 bacterium]
MKSSTSAKVKMQLLAVFKDVFQRFELNLIGKWIFIGMLIGLAGGLGAWFFMLLLDASKALFTGGLLHRLVPESSVLSGYWKTFFHAKYWWCVPLIPMIGGLISGVLVYLWAPEAEGHGTDGVIHSFHRGRGLIRGRVPLIKTIASAAIIGSGGSAGREGPIAQIGAGFGSLAGRYLKVSVKDRRLMVLAGAAAGISAIFQAPLGGAIFTTEVLYRNHELETEALIPNIISSLTAYSLYTRLVGREQLFSIPPLRFERAEELVLYTFLGLLCALAGVFYIRIFYGLREKLFKPLALPQWLKPALGGLLLGLLAVLLPQIWGGGYEVMQMAMEHKLTATLMVLLVFGKIFATSFTISSGGSGGVFAPSLFIGAMLGGCVGTTFAAWLPAQYVPDPTALVVVGMGGFFAGIAKVPIASIIMVSEMTGGYGLLVPMMLVSAITVLFTRNHSIYEKQALSTIDSPAHKGDFIADLLDGLTVTDTRALKAKPLSVRAVTSLSHMLKKIRGYEQNMLPVVDQEERVLGMIYFRDLRDVLFEGELDLNLVIAADVAKIQFPFVTPAENLHAVITKFAQYDMNELPVLESGSKKLLGVLSKHEVIYTYNQRLESFRAQEHDAVKRGGFL